MKKLYLLCFVLLVFCMNKLNAQTFNCYVANDHLVSPTVYEFDVWLEPTSTDFYLRAIQMCFRFDSAFIAGGATITPTYDNSVSQLQQPFTSGAMQWNSQFLSLSVPVSQAQICTGTPSTSSGHTLFSISTGAKRIVRVRMTSSLPYNCSSPKITMIRPTDPAPGLGVLKMAVNIWTSTCIAVVISNNGTYTNYSAQTLYSNVSNLSNLTVSATSPAIDTICRVGGNGSFNVIAQGNGSATPLTYQWKLNNNPLFDNATYQGVNTATLNITNPTVSGQISCDVSQCTPLTPVVSSQAATLVVDSCTIGIDEITGNYTLSAYPNPTSGVLSVFFNGANMSDIKISLVDILGNDIKFEEGVKDANYYHLNLSGIAKGIYILKVRDENENVKSIRVVLE